MLIMPIYRDSKRQAAECKRIYNKQGKHVCSVYKNVDGSYRLISRKNIVMQNNMSWKEVQDLCKNIGENRIVSFGK